MLGTLTKSVGLPEEYTAQNFRSACEKHIAAHGELKCFARYQAPSDVFWDDEKYRGEAYAAFAWAVYVAEVTVDLTTYAVTVDDFVALQEIGKVIHPLLAEGQITGGVAQAIGFALYEKVVWQNGRMINNQMTNYIMPTSVDLPSIRVVFEELGNVHGAHGAKGIGELPMDGPAPAVLSAVEDAIGIPFHFIPLLPEDLFEGVRSAAVPSGGSAGTHGSP
jgi:CO/xanthine dehydrogenase Mo-binding subunit